MANSLLTPNSSSPSFWEDTGSILGLLGALGTGIGAAQDARSVRQGAEFQADMADLNARMFEQRASDILRAGQIRQGHISLKAGKVKSSQRASHGARGIVTGAGSTAEEVATTDLTKEIDTLQINANAVRAANAARMQAVSFENQALMERARGSAGSSFLSGLSSFIGAALPVAASWYRRHPLQRGANQSGSGSGDPMFYVRPPRT